MSKEHTYSNGEVTIVWKSELCIHSRKCWHGLNAVFKPGERPWIDPNGAPTERIVEQVKQCPSGALTYRMEDGPTVTTTAIHEVEVSGDGPLLLKGNCTIRHADGREETKEGVTAFCRCGASNNKPFCDGSHRRTGFKG